MTLTRRVARHDTALDTAVQPALTCRPTIVPAEATTTTTRVTEGSRGGLSGSDVREFRRGPGPHPHAGAAPADATRAAGLTAGGRQHTDPRTDWPQTSHRCGDRHPSAPHVAPQAPSEQWDSTAASRSVVRPSSPTNLRRHAMPPRPQRPVRVRRPDAHARRKFRGTVSDPDRARLLFTVRAERAREDPR
jgi:hypothetical protein